MSEIINIYIYIRVYSYGQRVPNPEVTVKTDWRDGSPDRSTKPKTQSPHCDSKWSRPLLLRDPLVGVVGLTHPQMSPFW